MQNKDEDRLLSESQRMWKIELERSEELAKKAELVDVEAIAHWLINEILSDLPSTTTN